MTTKRKAINVQNISITVYSREQDDYLSLTDIARYRNAIEPSSIINNWMRSRATIEFIGLWETLHKTNFKPIEFERFKSEAGSNYFVLSPQRWVDTTRAIGIVSKSWRYGGTFAQKDIAFEFASWISPPFKLNAVRKLDCTRIHGHLFNQPMSVFLQGHRGVLWQNNYEKNLMRHSSGRRSA